MAKEVQMSIKMEPDLRDRFHGEWNYVISPNR